MIVKVLSRENNGPIDAIRQPTMPASNHHETDNEFAECSKLPGEGSIVSWIAQTKTDIRTAEN